MNRWRRLPAVVRIPIALAIVALSSCSFVAQASAARGGASLLFALGVIRLFAGPTAAQKMGYHD